MTDTTETCHSEATLLARIDKLFARMFFFFAKVTRKHKHSSNREAPLRDEGVQVPSVGVGEEAAALPILLLLAKITQSENKMLNVRKPEQLST